MTAPTGKPKGRPKGAKNKRTLATQAAMDKAATDIAAVLPGAFEGDAHGLLMAIYKNPAQPIELRLEAAKAAIKFEKPTLASIDVQGEHEHIIHRISDEPMSDEDWEREFVTEH